MKATGYIAVAAALCSALLYLVPNSVAQQRKFNPDGSFWIIGAAPKGFDDFGGINLNSHRSRRFPSSGVNLTNGTVLKFRTISVTRNALTFTTFARRGISYRFSGRFLRGGIFFSEVADEEPVLEGTLVKLANRQVVAESRIKFSYFGGT
jgi:hypothetical protein